MKKLVSLKFEDEKSLVNYVNSKNISKESIVSIVSRTEVYSQRMSDVRSDTYSEVVFILFYFE